jgi:ABC-type multidrug transport system fused ATPase/permease subunit
VSRLNNDVAIVEQTLSNNISMVSRAIITIVADLVMMFIVCWQLSLIALAGVFLSAFFQLFFITKQRNMQAQIQARKSALSVVTEESCHNIRTVKAFANEEEETKKFAIKNEALLSIGRTKALVTASQTTITMIILYGTLCATLFCAKYLYEKGEFQIEIITTFMLYILSIIFQFWLIAMALP